MKSAIWPLGATETNAVDIAISPLTMKSAISVLSTTETNIDSAISTVDDEVSDLSALVTRDQQSMAITVDDEIDDLTSRYSETNAR